MTDRANPFRLPGSKTDVEAGLALTPKFDGGLLAAIATDADTGEALMLAWMNAEALALSIETGEAHFFSRSRNRIWRKGEDSGNTLTIVEMRTDCDQDAIWLRVRMNGQQAACHTGHRTCFYRRIETGLGKSETAALIATDVPRIFDPRRP